MSEHDEVYGKARVDRLVVLLRSVAERIRELDQNGQLLTHVPELLKLLGDVRSELFHYEVRLTYDTPEVAESRRIVDQAKQSDFLLPEDPEDDQPWRPRPTE